MSGVLSGRRTGTDYSVSKSVRYTPCAKAEHTDEEELDEIAVVVGQGNDAEGPMSPRSAAVTCTTTDSGGSGPETDSTPHHNNSRSRSSSRGGGGGYQGGGGGTSGFTHANGPPRLLPSPYLPFAAGSDRDKLIGERLSSACINVASPVYQGKVIEQRPRSTSRQSVFEIVTNKLDRVKGRSKKGRTFSKESVAYINKAHVSDAMTPREIRKQRRKEIEEKFGKRGKQAKFERLETSTAGSDKDTCRWTFVFDPSGRLAYWWSFVVSIAFLYNFWVIIYRFAFEEIDGSNMAIWFTLDYFADFLYILDIAFHFRTGYLEDGVLQTDSTKLRIHYMNSTMFYIDCLCLLPLDFLYLSIGFKSMLRCFRLVKIYRFWAFLDRTERHTNYPNVVRTITLLHYLFAIYHWNACLMYIVTKHLDNEGWNYPDESDDVLTKYLNSLYWSTMTLTTIGDLPRPMSKGEYFFVIIEFVFGLLLFSTILGHVANIVTSISTARKDFQAKLDCVKTYMLLRRVPLRLQDRVIRWFDYLWLSKKSSDEEKTLSLLPDKLKAEIALHVHLDTLKRVEIFQNTEAGFLCELVLKLRPVLFSPQDYICRKGEVGKEMYIVNRGRLQVVADNGKTILATLRPGSYFGEISILNMGNTGNRRTASVRSVGYSDLFVLSKTDLWDVLKDYPTARVRLEAIAVKRLEKYKKAPIEQGKEELAKVALTRSKSTPGLVESSGKTTLETMPMSRHYTLPAGLINDPNNVHRGSRSEMRSLTPEDDVDDACSHNGHSGGSRHSGSGNLGTDTSAIRAAASADITNSMTVSSITSYITESSTPNTEAQALSTPTSPRVTAAPTLVQAMGGIEGFTQAQSAPPFGPPIQMSDMSSLGISGSRSLPHHPFNPYSPVTVPTTSYPNAISSCASGFPVSYPLSQTSMPPAATTGQAFLMSANQIPPLPASQSFTFSPSTTSNLPTSGSTGSLPRDPSHEILLQEISRLRERLVTLETENASMTIKLNQQQWEVEHRLAEIEMHICGSDSAGSCSDDKSVGNKESVI